MSKVASHSDNLIIEYSDSGEDASGGTFRVKGKLVRKVPADRRPRAKNPPTVELPMQSIVASSDREEPYLVKEQPVEVLTEVTEPKSERVVIYKGGEIADAPAKKPRAPRKKKVADEPVEPVQSTTTPVEEPAKPEKKPRKPRAKKAAAGGAVEGGAAADPAKPKVKRPLNSWGQAVKLWNSQNNNAQYIIPKKGTAEYDAVKELSDKLKVAAVSNA